MSIHLCTEATKSMALLVVLLCYIVAGCNQKNAAAVSERQSGRAPILNVNVIRIAKIENAIETSVFFGTLKRNRDEQPIRVEASLPAEIADALNAEDSVTVVIESQFVAARVTEVSPNESAGSKLVSLQLTDQIESENWSLGQTVKIRFESVTDHSGYWLPIAALSRESNGLWSTFVVASINSDDSVSANSKYSIQRKLLNLVQFDDNWALVQNALQTNAAVNDASKNIALKDGELVVVDGSHRVVPGQRVNALEVTQLYPRADSGVRE